MKRFTFKLVLLLVAGSILPSALHALPANLSDSPMARPESPALSHQARPTRRAQVLLTCDRQQKAEPMWLLSRIDLPAIETRNTSDASRETLIPVAPSVDHAAMEGNWFDSRLVQILRPDELIKSFNASRLPWRSSATVELPPEHAPPRLRMRTRKK